MLQSVTAPFAGFPLACIASSSLRTATSIPTKKTAAVAGTTADDYSDVMGSEPLGKTGLVGKPLWSQYSAKVRERMDNPKHRGSITKEQADAMNCDLVVAEHGAESCGDAVRIYWAVDRDTKRIKDAKFQTFGCATAIASSDVTAELCLGKTPEEAERSVTNLEVEKALRDSPDKPAVPPQKMHCSVLAHDVVHKAATSIASPSSSAAAAALKEDDEIVCECGRVTLGTLRNAIRANKLKTIADVVHYTKAGGFCKSCIHPGGHEQRKRYLVDILREEIARRDSNTADQQKSQTASKLKGKSLAAKAAIVQKAIDNDIIPLLGTHGGSIDLMDIEDSHAQNSAPVIHIIYLGQCSGCPGSTKQTLEFIQSKLRESLAEPALIVKVDNTEADDGTDSWKHELYV